MNRRIEEKKHWKPNAMKENEAKRKKKFTRRAEQIKKQTAKRMKGNKEVRKRVATGWIEHIRVFRLFCLVDSPSNYCCVPRHSFRVWQRGYQNANVIWEMGAAAHMFAVESINRQLPCLEQFLEIEFE